MKRLLCLLLVCVLCGAMIISGCSSDTGEEKNEVTQEDIEKNIVGKWILSEVDNQPALTQEKGLFDIVSTSKAYSSVSLTSDKAPWHDRMENKVNVKGNVLTISFSPHEGVSVVHEFTITNINDNEFTANYKFSRSENDSEKEVNESTVKFAKVSDDFSKDILGTWEGRCTSEGSEFDDGQEHRWEYKKDGTYVYYVKDGDNWNPSDNDSNEYFVAGNLLCTRWTEGKKEYREWWEISIDGDTMKWTALRKGKDDKTFNATFEMKKVKK